MGHGWRNYLVVAFQDLRGIGRVWGLDKHFPILGKRYVARVLCGSRRPTSRKKRETWGTAIPADEVENGGEIWFASQKWPPGHVTLETFAVILENWVKLLGRAPSAKSGRIAVEGSVKKRGRDGRKDGEGTNGGGQKEIR